MKKTPRILDPSLALIDRVELFPDDDPSEPVAEAIRCAHVDRSTGQIYVAREFVGNKKLLRGLENWDDTKIVPVCVAGEYLCVSLGWLEQTLPEYTGWWSQIRILVDRANLRS